MVASVNVEQKKEPDTRTVLEKAVGKRSQSLSLKEQVERFPQLQNAPMVKGLKAAGGADAQGVSFKPLGAQFRNVKCMSCGQWGHIRGDRECPQTGWNPFAASTTSAKYFNATDKPSETTT
jgi:CBF1 interacting corepressor